MIHRFERAGAIVAALVIVTASAGLVFHGRRDARIVVGKVHATDAPAGPVPTEPGLPETNVPQLAPDPLLGASGTGPGGAIAFRGAVNVPSDLKFFLVIGSDARPGEDITRTRGDSLHIACVDPLTRKGSIVGIPRDSWVNIPGYGTRKINSALALGGPDLLVRTIRDLTGLPISYYAITAFDGIVKIVDTLHGVDINVPYRMNDSFSGARFEPGWHHMDGRQVLAFSRDRHDVPGGDFGRSENQGRVILAALAKLRHETSDQSGIRRWLGVLFSYGRLDMPMTDAVELGVLARQIDPSGMYDVVAPGTAENRGGQSVVVLSDGAYALFRDVGADALADGKMQRETPPPTPKPKPTATPIPTAVPVPTTTPHVTLPPV